MINQPSAIKILTNVSVVKFKRKGKKFEVACYPNKVQNWRNGIETDLDEVLQTEDVYTNVAQGEVANKKALKAGFGDVEKIEIIKEILAKGQLQVSEKEREAELEQMRNNIADKIVKMTVNSMNLVPFPESIIKKAMEILKVKVQTTGGNDIAKKQALNIITEIKEAGILPIERAKMRVRVTFRNEEIKTEIHEKITTDYPETDCKCEDLTETDAFYLIQPFMYRKLLDLSNTFASGDMGVEIEENFVHKDPTDDNGDYGEAFAAISLEEEKKEAEPVKKEAVNPNRGDEIQCSTCKDAIFSSKDLFKAHYKTEWHLENVKRKMKKGDPLNEAEFLELRSMEIDQEMFGGKKKKEKRNRRKKKGKNRGMDSDSN